MKPADLYDEHAGDWRRSAPNSLSDFTGRPAVFKLCGDVKAQTVLDLGCGEGYCTREMASRGADKVRGIEISGEMVNSAVSREQELKQGIQFQQGDASDLTGISNDSVDLVLAVFLYNYMSAEEMLKSFKEVHRVLKAGGRFVFSVPHPCFGFIRRLSRSTFFFETEDSGYFSGFNKRFEGEIHCRDKKVLPVQMVHKPIECYVLNLSNAGFRLMPEIVELGVTEEHMATDPEFFTPVYDLPLHMAFRVEKG